MTKPVFLHCTWRTGSTFLFAQFRKVPANRCFQEPLHEVFATATRDGILSFQGESLANLMHHPQLDRPYFDEYVELIDPRTGRIPWARERQVMHRFFSPPDRHVTRYLQSLVANAERHQCRAVLQFCRSYGRLPWLRPQFDARHLFVYRAPRDQWMSCESVGPEYFMPFLCVIASQRDSIYRRKLSRKLSVPLPSAGWFTGYLLPNRFTRLFRRARAYSESLTPQDRYRIFYGEWRIAKQLGEQHCEQSVDMNRLSEDSNYRRLISDSWQVPLDECRMPRYDKYAISVSELEDIEQEMNSP